ncbi:hypothetical protein [Pseudomaricurvus sp. HS19]|uniref:hypothetical protein n=1 Tax=Pseudomaricurvus sp. HS19 TaxID=2692626 RepID=UPI00136ABD55|nr:hypothetical protein [Pseudomaricurvus sp. HS19]MYM64568.1 hypothetical protein [Pseudomaricurvus sp. HS19]
MNAANRLPAAFAELEPFVDQWCLATSNERTTARRNSTPEEREAFFNAGKVIAADALQLLDQKPLDQLDDKEQCLMSLLLSLAHVSLAVEIQGGDEARHALASQHMPITRSPSNPR